MKLVLRQRSTKRYLLPDGSTTGEIDQAAEFPTAFEVLRFCHDHFLHHMDVVSPEDDFQIFPFTPVD